MAEEQEPGAEEKRPKSLWKWLLTLLVLATMAVAGWFVWQEMNAKPDIWAPATVPFDPECTENCEILREGAGAHGSSDPEDKIEFKYNPAVDDDIAQYGDCLEGIVNCMTALDVEDADGMRACVTNAPCPDLCKERFAEKASGDAAAVEKAFYDLFIDPAGICVPEGD